MAAFKRGDPPRRRALGEASTVRAGGSRREVQARKGAPGARRPGPRVRRANPVRAE